MDGGTSWISHFEDNTNTKREIREFDSPLHLTDEVKREGTIPSLDLILPDDLLEKILAYLPIPVIFQASSVCRKWHDITTSKRFLKNFSHHLSQKPWYFMFTSSDEPIGYAYDPVFKKWYGLDLPCIETSNWLVASSGGLVCFMNNHNTTEYLYVCNPITKGSRKLCVPTLTSDYNSLAFSLNRSSDEYRVALVKSKKIPDNTYQWELDILIYNSETMRWMNFSKVVLTGWRGGNESAICDGVLYCLVYLTCGSTLHDRHGLVTFNLSSPQDLLIKSVISVSWPITCGRLMNIKEKLVMVGGIGKQDRPDVIKGIGIWVLNGKEFEEVARMPQKYFQGFGEIDDVFASSGIDDIVYIQSYGAPALLTFDMNLKQWKWSPKCPVSKRFPLQLFNGFCFEPRLEIAP